MDKTKKEKLKEELKEVRVEIREISDERRESLKDYRYWKRKEYRLKEELK